MSERMGGMTPEERADWIEQVTLAGIQEARRPVDVCLRIPHSAGLNNGGSTSPHSEAVGRALLERVKIRGRLWTEIKFNWSHGHSTPYLRKIHGGPPSDALWNPPPTHYEIAWMVRNEDFFVLRWAGPSFVREHLRLNAGPGVCGYFIGSECYIPARDYITRPSAEVDWTDAFERQWLFYQVWGQLLADPSTPDEAFERLIDERYGKGRGRQLLPALELASRIPLRIATFLNFTWDHTLYAEGFLRQKGLVSVRELIHSQPIEPSWMSILSYVEMKQPSDDRASLTPPALAQSCEDDAALMLAHVEAMGSAEGALRYELADIRAWASLGLYFACKIRAAVALARLEQDGEEGDRQSAREWIERAIGYWRRLVEITEPLYEPIPLQILGDQPFSWAGLMPQVLADLDLVDATGRA